MGMTPLYFETPEDFDCFWKEVVLKFGKTIFIIYHEKIRKTKYLFCLQILEQWASNSTCQSATKAVLESTRGAALDDH